MYRQLLRANIYSVVLIAKFGLLFIWELVFPQSPDYFGQYSLGLGLVSAFFVFAGMRGRVYVLNKIRSDSDFASLRLLITSFGIIAFGIVLWLNKSSDLVLIIALISLCKLGENQLEINTSRLQQIRGRDAAFAVINQHGAAVLFFFFVALAFDLFAALLTEAFIIGLTLLRQQRAMAGTTTTEGTPPIGIRRVLWEGGQLTAAATLNATLVTGFLYYAQAMLPVDATLLFAKVLATQAIFARVITGNNIFFLKEIRNKRAALRTGTQITALAGLIALFALAFVTQFKELASTDHAALYTLVTIFTGINVANIMLRQHIILTESPLPLIVLHAVELAVLFTVLSVFEVDAFAAFTFFTALRAARVLVLAHLRLSNNSPTIEASTQ